MTDKERRAAAAPPQRPRSPRVPVEFSVDVEGMDSTGKPFNVKAKAVKISRGGATIMLEAPIALGTTIKLTPPFGGQLIAEVNGVWQDEIEGHQMVGVKLLDANGWFAD